jgi:hypothetical protein
LKKYICLILFVLLVSMLAVGCTSSNSGYKQGNTEQSSATPAQPLPASAQAAPATIENTTEVQQFTPTAPAYDDAAWAQYVHRSIPLLKADFDNMRTSASNQDYTTLADYAQNMINDTQKAIDENAKYKTSPKCQEAQNEWGLGLKDYNSAGKFLILAANDGKTNSNDLTNVNKAKSLIVSGAGHINRASAFLSTANQ